MASTSFESVESFVTYTQGVEQDEQGSGDLPTYDDLAAQNSPNSRFGRWKGWIEKRAAERYAETTPEELERRRARGWGEQRPVRSLLLSTSTLYDTQHRSSFPRVPLHVRIDADLPAVPKSATVQNDHVSTEDPSASTSATVDFHSGSQQSLQTTAVEALAPTHLQVHQFGSRFLPHATSPIRCVLPLQRDHILLVGTDQGLSVLNMYPAEWSNGDDGDIGLIQKGPSEAQARVVWTGEAVYQMSILEYEDIGEGTPQGVVLALVGPDPDAPSASSGHQESLRSLRMYNLASLTSLAKAILSQQAAPVDLRRASDWNVQQTPVKKHHRPASSITRGLKNLIIESPTRSQQPATSYQAYLTTPTPKRLSTAASADPSWDVVEDLPLRWATDFVPLAAAGTRLASASAVAYALWQEGGSGPGGGRHGRRTLLAVATKYNIFLYETPKGERAFHFLKEFYTPTPPRHLAFVQQSVQNISRSPSDTSTTRAAGIGHSRAASSDFPFPLHNNRASLAGPATLTYSAQTAIFVIFEKKAGIIRVADAAVTEVEMYDTGALSGGGGSSQAGRDQLNVGSSLGARRSRASIDFMALRESKGAWVLPTEIELPVSDAGVIHSRSVYVLTRGKQSHIIPAPLPPAIAMNPPLYTVTWNAHPTSVTPRVCEPPLVRRSSSDSTQPPAFLQLVGMGEDGIEVHEIALASLANRRGKGKAVTPLDPPHTQSFIGETGFLAYGGHWHRLASAVPSQLERTESAASTSSFDSVETEEVMSRLRAEAGVYGWLRKGAEDWRVFWVGGDARDVKPCDEDGVLV
ncbi:hypothetical protein F5I97DRAFT_828436 [Phlebopus sp. FC_14]|nr:hypothetical protein F5I97DRAFT_828436 [Phlebopus sp. FC_14]